MRKSLPPPPLSSSPTRRRVLALVLDGVRSPYRIAKRLELDKSTVKYHLDKLSVDGLVSKDSGSWRVTDGGRAALLAESGQVPLSPISFTSSPKVFSRRSSGNERGEKTSKVDSVKGEVTGAGVGVRVRLHRVWLDMGLVERREPFESKRVLKSGAWFSDVVVADSKVRLFSNGRLMGKLPPFWGRVVEDCERELKRYVAEWAPMVRDVLGCGLSSEFRVCQGEVAFVGHEYAKRCAARKLKLLVRDQNGKVWLLVDKSLGVPELEATHPELQLEDGKVVERFWNDVRDGRWNDMVLGLSQQNEVLRQVSLSQQLIIKEVTALGGFRGRRE